MPHADDAREPEVLQHLEPVRGYSGEGVGGECGGSGGGSVAEEGEGEDAVVCVREVGG